jgi:hypothetical protein
MRSRDLEALFGVCLVACLLTLGMVLAGSLLAAVARVLRQVSAENRRMEPGQVWLNLIPIFNIIWATVTVERVAESLRNEFRERAMDGPAEQYGRGYGLKMLGLLATGVLFYPAFICYPIAFGCAIGYWREMNRYAERLRSDVYTPPPTDEGW